jgi:UDP-glucose 4-epimerase
MNILVTGATGKVGSRLAKRLAARGDQVRALVRDRKRAAELLGERIELVEGDLLEPSSLPAAVRGVDAVVHCAAFFRGSTAEQAHAVNDLGTQHLARAARAAGVKRFVFTSTGLVYGPNGGRLSRESDACAPIAAYPVSKLAAEKFLFSIEGLDVRVLRLPFVYGDGDAHIAEALPMMRTFPPTQRMSLGHHIDIAQAVMLVLDATSPGHRIYNVCDDEAPDNATLFASVGAPPPDGSEAERARLRGHHGWQPTARGARLQARVPAPRRRPRRGRVAAQGDRDVVGRDHAGSNVCDARSSSLLRGVGLAKIIMSSPAIVTGRVFAGSVRDATISA